MNISYDELSENLKHEVKNYELTKINYKTVIASIKQQHPQILRAKFEKNADEIYVLTITVNYEFLPEIREEIFFDKREIKAEEAEETHIKNMKNYLRNMREQVSLLTNVQVLSGKL